MAAAPRPSKAGRNRMDFLQTLLITLVIFSTMVAGYMLVTGTGVAKSQKRRMQALRYRHSESLDAKVDAQFRRAIAARKPKTHKVAGSGSRMEALAVRLDRTGKTWTVSQYIYASVGLMLAVAVVIFIQSGALLLSLGIGLMVGAGLPHMVVGFFISKRTNAFVAKFPDGIELLVRGLRSGLPVTETLGVVAQEVPGPVGVEFKSIVDRIKVGKTMEDSLQDTADRLGIPEFNFFTITLAIQRETGGNLAETLSNLADVLRKRSQMKLKIRAMSSESKASAYIVGSLPFIVFGLIWWINPNYVAGFFIDDRLIVAGLGAMGWMSIGVLIMAKMVNFEI
jgi:tight adherence protein B